MTRKGKHKPGNVRIGVYVEPFRKAVAIYLAKRLNMTLTDVLWHGIEALAIGSGIIDKNGEVTKEHKAEIDAVIEIVKQSEVKG